MGSSPYKIRVAMIIGYIDRLIEKQSSTKDRIKERKNFLNILEKTGMIDDFDWVE